jgi:hypothetical protein
MRILSGLLALFFCTTLRGTSPDEGSIVETATYRGVILTPAVMKNSFVWKHLNPDARKANTFWTPTRAQIAKAEKALSLRLDENYAASQPGGFHFRGYYTPKNYSRDRLARPPEDPIYYGWIADLRSPHLRQYIGVNDLDGKELLIAFLENPPAVTWKSSWSSQAPFLSYSIESGEFSHARFDIVLEDR